MRYTAAVSKGDDILRGSPSAGEAIAFKRHLALPGAIFLVAEIACVVVPLLHLFAPHIEETGDLLRIAVPAFVGAELVWLGALALWFRPLYRTVVLKRRGKRLPEEVALEGYQSSWSLPLRLLLLRTLLWSAVALVHGLYFVEYSGWSLRGALELTALAIVHGFATNLGRVAWLQYLLARSRRRLFRGVARLRMFADGYFPALILVSLTCVGGTLTATAAFVYFFLPVTIDQYLAMQPYFALALVVTSVGLFLFGLRARRIVDNYLESQGGGAIGRSLEANSAGDGLATVVYRRAQALPYRFALVNWLLWCTVAAGATFLSRPSWQLGSDDSILMFGTVVVIAVGASLYQALWHREIMRPLLDHLTLRHRLPVRGIRTSLTLRTKLLLSFGGMVLFAVGIALVWGFVQYKNLTTKFTASQADLGLAWMRSEVQGAVAARSEPPTPPVVRSVLRQLAVRNPEATAVFFYLPKRDNPEVVSFGGGPMGAPVLPWYAVAEMTRSDDATIRLDAHSLTGRRGRLRVEWRGQAHDLGSLAVFYPSYRGRGPSLVRPLKELLVFFLALFGICGGIVVLTVSQFVKPIRRLEQRADGMARGELAQPVSSGGEGDEIGRLTFALEEMRRALREKLRSTEEVNLDLERAVQRRTADLAKKNRELAETLQKLTRAQDQLVQAEKMASIGQLVAGIAHEINNPVNAIVNTVNPLKEAIDDLADDDPQVRDEAAGDVKDMVRVVQRGAQRTKAIVQALHNYSRTDDESVVEVDLNRSLDDSLELLRHLLKGVVQIERQYGDVERVVGHAGQLNQVFMNLIANAAHALGSVDDARIVIRTEQPTPHEVSVSITDNGPGIPADVLPRIFDPFFTTKDVGEGSGLGLSIVHGIVERHGGSIHVDSSATSGTTFRVVLPRGERVSVAQGDGGESHS